MASLDSLPADQRAVLQLLLKQGKSYEDLSGLLRIETDAVRERARDAVDALGPDDPAVDDDRRDEIADYLLGQQTASQRAATREYLEGSASGRSWARTTATTLRGLAPDGLPDVPAERAEVDQAFEALDRRTERREEVQRSSRTGGILVLVGLGIALAVGLILLITGGDDDKGKSASTGTTAGGTPQLVAQATLRPPAGGNNPIGIAFVARQGKQIQLGVQARGVQPSTQKAFYAIWLSSSSGGKADKFLGFVPTPVGQDRNLQALSPLAGGPGDYKQLLLTRETQQKPTKPSTVVLQGTLAAPPPGTKNGATDSGTATAPAPAPQGQGAAPPAAPPTGGTTTTP